MTELSPLPERFDGNSAGYRLWRESRLALQHNGDGPGLTPLSPTLTNARDHHALQALCTDVQNYGFALYEWQAPAVNPAAAVTALHAQLSLAAYDRGVVHEEGGLSLLTDMSGTSQGRFIPYTTRAMGWHTDGYYNTREESLNCFTLHCISPAREGGALSLLDHQLVLIALYDDDPDLVALLSHPDAMMIPGNKDDLGHDRPARYSPVLFIRRDGTPGAHYTTRTKHIAWRTPETLEAALRMKAIIDERDDWCTQITLQPNQGLITRNILHRREAYTDHPDAPRKMLRGRYLQSPSAAASAPPDASSTR